MNVTQESLIGLPIRDDDLEDSRWECRINQLTIATLSRDSDTIFSIFTIRIMGFKELFRWDASVSFDKFLIWNFTNESVSFDSLPGPLWCWEKQTHFRGFQSTKWHQPELYLMEQSSQKFIFHVTWSSSSGRLFQNPEETNFNLGIQTLVDLRAWYHIWKLNSQRKKARFWKFYPFFTIKNINIFLQYRE